MTHQLAVNAENFCTNIYNILIMIDDFVTQSINQVRIYFFVEEKRILVNDFFKDVQESKSQKHECKS